MILAFEEVENALVNLANRKQQIDELERQLNDSIYHRQPDRRSVTGRPGLAA